MTRLHWTVSVAGYTTGGGLEARFSRRKLRRKESMRSLADRVRAYEQQKARLADTEAKLKLAEKRARTRRLIETGGLVEKTGLSELPTNALYGALLSLRGGLASAEQMKRWADIGAEALAEEAREIDRSREAIVLTFPQPRTKGEAASLKAAGFRFNKVLDHWEGLAHFQDAQELAALQGGEARRVLPAGPRMVSSYDASDRP